MDVRVLMSSGDEDEWEDVADATVTERIELVIWGQGDSDEQKLMAVYAPGMWMKVEYDVEREE